MGRLSDVRVIDPVLTNIARGYQNTEFIAETLFPVVQVDQEAGKIPVFGKDMFKVYETKRAIRAKSNQMGGMGLSLTPYATVEHDIAQPIDTREIKASMLNLEVMATNATSEALRLGLEKEVADLAQDYTAYPTGNKETLTTGNYIDEMADPLKYFSEKKEQMRAIIGKVPNTLHMGAAVYSKLINSAALIDRIKYSMSGVITLDLLKAFLEIPNIYVGNSLYTDDDGLSFHDVWGKNMILSYQVAPSGMERTPYEPSFGYLLRVKGHPQVDKYTEENGKIVVVRNTDNYAAKVVGIESAFMIKNAVA